MVRKRPGVRGAFSGPGRFLLIFIFKVSRGIYGDKSLFCGNTR